MICKVGGRSANACAHLAGLGFDVVNVSGGTMAWLMSGRDVVEGSQPR
jgi:rhodanese-related sulfurtransferase